MNIGKIAEMVGLPVKTVRYYDEINLFSPRERSASGYRQYSQSDLAKLILVRRARAFGFTIDEVRELLSLYTNPTRTSADVKRIALSRLKQLEEGLNELRLLRRELSHLVAACDGDGRPDCPILVGLSAVPAATQVSDS